jgi:hypothetical protein
MVAPMIPPARRGGRPRDVNMREVINGLLYLQIASASRRGGVDHATPDRH